MSRKLVHPNEWRSAVITAADCGENHVGNEQIGKKKKGFNLNDLKVINHFGFENKGKIIELHNQPIDGLPEAYVLHVKKGLEVSTWANSDALWNEIKAMGNEQTDDKYLCTRRKKVLQKHKRRNTIYADFNQEPDYALGKGRIHAFETKPVANSIRKGMNSIPIQHLNDSIFELNIYDHEKARIGWHGDTERNQVFGINVGEDRFIRFQWYLRNKPVGDMVTIPIKHGDCYVMDFKSTGNDWKMSSIYTLRHCAGNKTACDIMDKERSKKLEKRKRKSETKLAGNSTKKQLTLKEIVNLSSM